MFKSKRNGLLSILLAVVMIVSLLPVSIFADTGDDALTPSDISYAVNGKDGNDITLSKTAVRTAADEWEITLETTISTPVQKQPLDVTFVIDVSGSMAWCTQDEHKHGSDCKVICGNRNHKDNPYWDSEYHSDSCFDCGKHTHNTNGNVKGVQGGEHCPEYNEDSRLDYVIKAVKGMVEELTKADSNTKFNYVIFSSEKNGNGVGKKDSAKVIHYVKDSEKNNDLDKLKASGGTQLSAGVALGIDQFDSTSANKVLVIVADGESNDDYPTEKTDDFKELGGTIYTVGFLFSNYSFSKLASGEDYAKKVTDKDILKEMEAIATGIASAMIIDPMGDGYSVVESGTNAPTFVVRDLSTGVIDDFKANVTVENDGKTLYWTPTSSTPFVFDNHEITITYRVKLDSIPKTADVYDEQPLNKEARLAYSYDEGDKKTSASVNYPIPKATYEVATLETSWLSNEGVTLKTSVKESKICDWYLEGTGGDKGAQFIYNIPATLKDKEQKELNYNTSSVDAGEEKVEVNGTVVVLTSGAHTLVNIYNDEPLKETYTTSYDWGTSYPSTATIPTGGSGYQSEDLARASVDTSYTSEKTINADDRVWKFSGWDEGKLKGFNVHFTGVWTFTPNGGSGDDTYTLTVLHIGIDGNTQSELGKDITPGCVTGEAYTTSVGSFAGWTYNNSNSGNTSGTFDKSNITVTYYYSKTTTPPPGGGDEDDRSLTLYLAKTLLDEDGNRIGDGTKFSVQILDADGVVVKEVTVNSNGAATVVRGLEYGERYYVREMVGEGFKLGGYDVNGEFIEKDYLLFESNVSSNVTSSVIRIGIVNYASDDVDIINENPPLVEYPDVDLGDNNVVEIDPDEVPLAEVPSTGDNSLAFMAIVAIFSVLGIAFLVNSDKKKRRNEA